jgi:hypothetical protein
MTTPPLPPPPDDDEVNVYLKTRIFPDDKPIQMSEQSGAVEHIEIGSFGGKNIIGS